MSLFVNSDEAAKILFDTKSRIIDYAIKHNQKIITTEQLRAFITTEMRCLKHAALHTNNPHIALFNEIESLAKQTITTAEQPKLP